MEKAQTSLIFIVLSSNGLYCFIITNTEFYYFPHHRNLFYFIFCQIFVFDYKMGKECQTFNWVAKFTDQITFTISCIMQLKISKKNNIKIIS